MRSVTLRAPLNTPRRAARAPGAGTLVRFLRLSFPRAALLMSWRVIRCQLRGDANERAIFPPLPQDSCAATLVSPMTFHHTPPTTAQMRKEATPQMAPRRIVVALVRVRVRVRVRLGIW